MATLHVRGIPDTTYDKIKQLADDSNRSLSQQVITLLDNALAQQLILDRQRALFNNIVLRRMRTVSGQPIDSSTSTLALLREDRAR